MVRPRPLPHQVLSHLKSKSHPALLLCVAAPAAAALFFVYPPETWPNGKPYSVHAASWWKWALAQSADKSAILDQTGAKCGVGQSGRTFYLAGAFSGEPTYRKCTIPSGRTLVFPIINSAYFAFPSDPAEQRTEVFIRSQVAGVADATELEVEIDGVAVPHVERWCEESTVFSATLPDDDIFGAPAGTVLSPSVDAGYYLAVAPLLPGKHTLHFHGELDGFVEDVTYELTIKLLPF